MTSCDDETPATQRRRDIGTAQSKSGAPGIWSTSFLIEPHQYPVFLISQRRSDEAFLPRRQRAMATKLRRKSGDTRNETASSLMISERNNSGEGRHPFVFIFMGGETKGGGGQDGRKARAPLIGLFFSLHLLDRSELSRRESR